MASIATETFTGIPGRSEGGRSSPYAVTPGDDPVLAVNGRLPPDSGPSGLCAKFGNKTDCVPALYIEN